MKRRAFLVLLCLLLLCGCGAPPAAPVEETPAQTLPAEPPPADPAPESPSPAAPEPTETGAPDGKGETDVKNPGKGARVRCSVHFRQGTTVAEGAAAMEEALGREVELIWVLEKARTVSVELTSGELALVKELSCVASASEEMLNEPQSNAPGGSTGQVTG